MRNENLLNLGFLISRNGSGNTFRSVLNATHSGELDAQISIVISDHPDIPPITRELIDLSSLPFRERRLTDRNSVELRDQFSREVAEDLNDNGVEVVIMDGFSTVLTRPYMKTLNGITLNIHPGLVPDSEDASYLFEDGSVAPWNRGLLKQKAVERFLGGTHAGATVHIATENPDFGPVLERRVVSVNADDTVETLYPRIKIAEGEALLAAIQRLALEKQGRHQ
jgi:phosphoribosylglycinamide formyltransferase 1